MALHFDGTNDTSRHGDIAALDSLTAGTWMFWLNIDSVKSQGFFSKGTGSAGTAWSIGTGVGSTNDLFWSSNNQNGRFVNGTAAAQIGVWNHFTFVYDGAGSGNAGRLKGWLNGVVQTLTYSGTIGASTADVANQVTIGSHDATGFCDGLIAHVRAWNTALTEAEILREWRSYLPFRTTNLVLWCPLDDTGVAFDYSGNGNNGTVTDTTCEGGPGEVIYPEHVILAPHSSTRRLMSQRYLGASRRNQFRAFSSQIPRFTFGA